MKIFFKQHQSEKNDTLLCIARHLIINSSFLNDIGLYHDKIPLNFESGLCGIDGE